MSALGQPGIENSQPFELDESTFWRQLHQKHQRLIRVLQLIADSDEQLNKSKIIEAITLERSTTEQTVRTDLQNLEDWNMIHLERTNRRMRGGLRFSYYRLTSLGLQNLITSAYNMHLGGFFNTQTFRHLAHKYQGELTIFGLWDTFQAAGVEDMARRRLPVFLLIFHGQQLEHYVYHASGSPDCGLHGTKNWLKDAGEYECTPDDDVEAFLDPYLLRPDDTWLAAVSANEILRSIYIRSLVKQAARIMRHANRGLRHVPVTTLTGNDLNLFRDLVRQTDSIRTKLKMRSRPRSRRVRLRKRS
jgi:predicted transcriptional regulator